jgi:hypothetical protein
MAIDFVCPTKGVQKVILPPTFTGSSGASAVASAVEHMAPAVSDSAVAKLAGRTQYGTLIEGCDNAAPNARKLAWTSLNLPANVFYWCQFCCVHGIHRIMMALLTDKSFAGSVYAVHFVSSIPTHHERMLKRLSEWLQEELDFRKQIV